MRGCAVLPTARTRAGVGFGAATLAVAVFDTTRRAPGATVEVVATGRTATDLIGDAGAALAGALIAPDGFAVTIGTLTRRIGSVASPPPKTSKYSLNDTFFFTRSTTLRSIKHPFCGNTDFNMVAIDIDTVATPVEAPFALDALTVNICACMDTVALEVAPFNVVDTILGVMDGRGAVVEVEVGWKFEVDDGTCCTRDVDVVSIPSSTSNIEVVGSL